MSAHRPPTLMDSCKRLAIWQIRSSGPVPTSTSKHCRSIPGTSRSSTRSSIRPTPSSASGRTDPISSRDRAMTSLRHSNHRFDRRGGCVLRSITQLVASRGLRRGYTLMELLLVLGIIVIAAAAVAPSFRGVMRSAALKAAANAVRAELTRAHVHAMKTGRIQVFQYELGGAKYKVEPYIGGDDALESPDGDPNSANAAPPTTSVGQLPPGQRALPEGTKFAAGDAAVESRSERVEQELSSAGGSGVTWSRPILFYPDG